MRTVYHGGASLEEKAMIMLQGNLVLRVFARDSGCCRVCLLQEGKTDRCFSVKRIDMTIPQKNEKIDEVILICEICEAVVARWLALVKYETQEQSEVPLFM